MTDAHHGAYPRYRDLPCPAGEYLPRAVGVWGPDDQIGTWNNVTPRETIRAAQLVKEGRRFNLNLPLHLPLGLLDAGSHDVRKPPVHSIMRVGTGLYDGRDDKVELYPQASTQWDGLTHVGDSRHGFYNGVRGDQITSDEGTRNGIENVAEFGIATRGILIDLPRHFAATGCPWAPVGSQVASVADLQACLDRSRVQLRPGDVLLVRTGWLEAFLGAEPARRNRLYKGRDYSGIAGSADMWEFLWNSRIAAVASDNVTVEAFPVDDQGPSLHLAIARLGLNLGELFDLEALAEHCAATSRTEVFFVSMPLNLRGGVGSPANALAIL